MSSYVPGGAPGPPESAAEGSGPDGDSRPDAESGAAASSGEELRGEEPVITIVISQPEESPQPKVAGGLKASAEKKWCLPSSDSEREQCRICQQQAEEPLIDLGCRCRGELAKAHRSCIEIWFRSRGSNKCEICQQVATNVALPEPQPTTNYWVWRVDSAYGVLANRRRGGRERGCFSPLWVAFAILIGGLLLDVLISVSLRVSALPVNIIIGVLIVLGLGTALRLVLECCHECGSRRNTQRQEITINPTTVNPGHYPAV